MNLALSKERWLDFMEEIDVFALDIQTIGEDPYKNERIIILLSDGIFTFKRIDWEIILELWDSANSLEEYVDGVIKNL